MKYHIGQLIKHGPGYAVTCAERFSIKFDPENLYVKVTDRPSKPQPLFLSGESFVIGLRRAIMDDYHYRPQKVWQDEVEQASASGKFEECLICTKQIKPFKPFLVRKKDVL